MRQRKFYGRVIAIFIGSIVVLTGAKIYDNMQPVVSIFKGVTIQNQGPLVQDRFGEALSVSYQNRWNTADQLFLHQVPEFLKQAFVHAEDQSFFTHHGVDWGAKGAAVWQNIKARRIVRGASSITEQVVRMLTNRPRKMWSKLFEMIEAYQLESYISKHKIFEFYLNQLPYAAQRRGIVQGARYYFNRDLATLTKKEMLALVVLARAPSHFDLYKDHQKIEKRILQLAGVLRQKNILNAAEYTQISQQKFVLETSQLNVNAFHFMQFIKDKMGLHFFKTGHAIRTTLNANLQRDVQKIIDDRVQDLRHKFVENAGALVVDHQTGDILAWVVAGNGDEKMADAKNRGQAINAVTVLRQPGSALKPFLYATALVKGWHPATWIDDSPLSEAIGCGLHRFKNYSHRYYGPITLREALGNSLNIPAIRTIRYVGVKPYLDILHQLGFDGLHRHADVYDEGLALGNGEVTLYELVQAYVVLAHKGRMRPLRFIADYDPPYMAHQIFSPEVASLIGHILSDPWARQLEFGRHSVMNLPIQTAIKTGTSTDYRDAWAVGYNHRYVVGIWMGNMDNKPMNGVTGSSGPMLALRSIFAKLNRGVPPQSLFLSPRLIVKNICLAPAMEPVYGVMPIINKGERKCLPRTEYFVQDSMDHNLHASETDQKKPVITKPTQGLHMALDPRIPRDHQIFEFQVEGIKPGDTVEWILNDKTVAQNKSSKYRWVLERGTHRLSVCIHGENREKTNIGNVKFVVK